MKVVIIHGQNHKGSTYHIARMVADLCLPCNWCNEGIAGSLCI